jgi:uncharacterized protein
LNNAFYCICPLAYNGNPFISIESATVKFAEDNLDDGYIITAYDASSIQINGKNFSSGMVITQDKLVPDWEVASIEALQPEHIETIAKLKPELVLLGTGTKLVFPEVRVYAMLIQQGIGVEVMDTGAACRTYNILSGEGRRVVAGLIL